MVVCVSLMLLKAFVFVLLINQAGHFEAHRQYHVFKHMQALKSGLKLKSSFAPNVYLETWDNI